MANLKIEIKSIWGSILFSYEKEDNTVRDTLLEAIKVGADLRSANLRSANLEGANLRSANLEGADLRSANLEGANLRSANLEGANLVGADLRSANLEGADLVGANLRSANLEGANLRSANLEGANLRSANLEGANLEGANLLSIKADFFEILIHAIPEIASLKQSLIDGKVDGSVYEGECACLVGTIANARCTKYTQLEGIIPAGSRPAERLFLSIKKGDTVDNNAIVKIVLAWIAEFEHYVMPTPTAQ